MPSWPLCKDIFDEEDSCSASMELAASNEEDLEDAYDFEQFSKASPGASEENDDEDSTERDTDTEEELDFARSDGHVNHRKLTLCFAGWLACVHASHFARGKAQDLAGAKYVPQLTRIWKAWQELCVLIRKPTSKEKQAGAVGVVSCTGSAGSKPKPKPTIRWGRAEDCEQLCTMGPPPAVLVQSTNQKLVAFIRSSPLKGNALKEAMIQLCCELTCEIG